MEQRGFGSNSSALIQEYESKTGKWYPVIRALINCILKDTLSTAKNGHPSTEDEDSIGPVITATPPSPQILPPLYPTKGWIFMTLEPLNGYNKIRVICLLTER